MKKTIYEIWSFIINMLYWSIHFPSYSKANRQKREITSTVQNIGNVREVMSKFNWTKDKFFDWKPWVITIIDNQFKDDCDGAAVLGKLLLSLINIDSNLVTLYGDDGGHMVCVSKNGAIMISNNNVVLFSNTFNWKQEVLDHFEGKYTSLHVW